MKIMLRGRRLLLASHSGRFCSAGNLLYAAARILKAQGIELSVVFPRERPEVDVASAYRNLGVTLLQQCNNFLTFDLVVVNCQALADYLTRVRSSIPVLFWIHEAWHHRDMKLMNTAISKSSGIIFQSRYQYDFLYRDAITGTTAKIFYLPNFSTEYDDHEAVSRSEYRVKNAICVGAMNPRKRTQDFIQSILPWAGKVRACLVGDQTMLDDESRTIIQQAPDLFLVLGTVNNKEAQSLIRKADIFVHPSSAESQSIAVLEAMLHGTPIIAADLPAYRYMGLENGLNCLTYPPGQVSELSRLIGEALNSEPRMKALGANARETYRSNFGVDRFTIGLLRIVGEVLT